jgi:lysyl-tRNA synthetase class 2
MKHVAETLRQRQGVRLAARSVFENAGFLEVDTPVLCREVLPEPYIEPPQVHLSGGRALFLQASPEACMKRLLAAGSGAIYQFAHAFRDGERGPLHDVEFILLEWYAPGFTLDDAAGLLARLTTATLGTEGLDRVTCRDAFLSHAGVDPLSADAVALRHAVDRLGIRLPEPSSDSVPSFDALFELLLSEAVMPALGHERPVLLEAWPPSQAAFARLDAGSPPTARRFELVVRGVELANGWEEETCPFELTARVEAANAVRAADGRRVLPVPECLIAAHGPAMPAGVGAAIGFDRLVMLAADRTSIDTVRCFSSETA